MSQTRRRQILLCGSALVAFPRLALPQAKPAPRWRIGMLSPLPRAPRGECVRGLVGWELYDGLAKVGLIEGVHYEVVRRCTEGRVGRLPELARDLVSEKPDVIVAHDLEQVAAARSATDSIPIVMVYGPDPVAHGWAKSLGHPGGNLTGLTFEIDVGMSIGMKHFELFKEVIPGVRRIVLLHPREGDPNMALFEKSMAEASRRLGIEIVHVDIANAEGVESAFRQIRAMKAEALLTTPMAAWRVGWNWKLLLAAIERDRLPSMLWASPRVAQFLPGALLYFGTDIDDQPRRAATYVERILKGAKPGDLPIERPTRTTLIVDRKVARSLGIQIPQSVLVRADRVVE